MSSKDAKNPPFYAENIFVRVLDNTRLIFYYVLGLIISH